jgi:micrococcal nuclease
MKYFYVRVIVLIAGMFLSFAPRETLLPSPPEKVVLRGKVIGIMDGDTFDLLNGTEKVRVRLEGIDSPEKGQPFGNNAKKALSDLCFGQNVQVAVSNKDRYGRAIARVYLTDGRCINEEMLRQGMAWHFKRYSDDARWARMENTARSARVGLWADPRPVAPWEWRSQRYKKSSS